MQALILVDLQNDFFPGGALAVPQGDQVLPVVNALIPKFEFIVATQDWHPEDHGSFAVNHPDGRIGDVIDLHGLAQVLWPVHCVQGTLGAELVPGLDAHHIRKAFVKGTDPTIDSYSGFFDNGHRKATGLSMYLREHGIEEVVIVGLALDYCVRFTALDAVSEGFKTTLMVDATRGVELQTGDCDRALAQLQAEGVRLMTSDAW